MTNTKLYCSNCDHETKTHLIEKKEQYEVRDGSFSVTTNVFVCNECKQEIYNEELDDKTLDIVYAQYRKKHNLSPPEKIKEIRRIYSLSQRAMSRILEWGEATIARYETGSLQDQAHNEVLELIQKPENMAVLFRKNKHLLTTEEAHNLEQRLNSLLQENAATKFLVSFEEFLTSAKTMDEFSGYREFDLNRIKNLILYISSKNRGILKTKLNKLLWYSDFLHFKSFSVSLTGATYFHLPLGPVPDNYEAILTLMIYENKLKKDTIVYDAAKAIYGEKIIAAVPYDKAIFSEQDLETVDYVISYFRHFNSTKIKNYSHDEKAYKQTGLNEKISYIMSKDLSLSLA